MIKKNKIFSLLIHLYLIILLTPDLSGRGIARDAETELFLSEMTTPIVNVANLNSSSVDLYLFNDNSVNAFVTCGQKIFVNTGLIMEFDDPSMLRGVLAHETGHIAGAHLARSDIALKKAQAPMIIGLLLGIGAAVAGGDSDAVQGILLGSQQIAQGMVAKYSRGQEAAADQAAFQYLEKLGLSSKGMIDVLYNFADQEALSARNQSSRVRSHPISRQRIMALENQAVKSKFYNQRDSLELTYRYNMIRAKLEGFLKRPDDIIRKYEKNDSDYAIYASSVALYRKALTDKAIDKINILIDKYPTNPWYYELKGQILYESGKIKPSIEPYEKAVKFSTGHPLLNIALASAYLALNDKEYDIKAQNLLNNVIKKDQKNSYAWFQLAIAEARLGNIGKADLYSAERYFVLGDVNLASFHAKRSKNNLKDNGPLLMRAEDIILDSENKQKWKKRCPV
ncbi:MAG: M48 family metalloprotease [Hyphomicrobiales bacterium]|nr:M48 family metalloprotease [Hyphomicrobiales bacterium]